MELCVGGELFDRIVVRGQYIERTAAAVLTPLSKSFRHSRLSVHENAHGNPVETRLLALLEMRREFGVWFLFFSEHTFWCCIVVLFCFTNRRATLPKFFEVTLRLHHALGIATSGDGYFCKIWSLKRDAVGCFRSKKYVPKIEKGTNHDEVINAIMQDVDTNKDHHISYEEFTAIMKAGINWRKAREQLV
ncbi:EF-hand domain [Dillenia turbinata]|uniref:EF-hand domain n=1 Tax=Dillenia turbinata TaxID=194707 RepID=A0AAN8V8L2_9MAGN